MIRSHESFKMTRRQGFKMDVLLAKLELQASLGVPPKEVFDFDGIYVTLKRRK